MLIRVCSKTCFYFTECGVGQIAHRMVGRGRVSCWRHHIATLLAICFVERDDMAEFQATNIADFTLNIY